jgi:hypothetical protein
MFKKPEYTAYFISEAKVVTPAEEDEFLAMASLDNLKALLPEINQEENPDLLYVASDLFVAGMMNRNGHAISLEDSIKLAPLFVNKFIDIEHKRDKITGTILKYAFTEFGSSKIIEDISGYDKPFNIAYGGIVWKMLYPNLVKLLISASDISSESYKGVSSSWEVGVYKYDIAIGSKIVSEAEIVTDAKKKSELEKYLKKNKGSGMKNGEHVYQLIRWPVLAIGAGFTAAPAASVKGVVVSLGDIDEEDANEEDADLKEPETQENDAEDIIQEQEILENSVAEIQNIEEKTQNISQKEDNCVNRLHKDLEMKNLQALYELLEAKEGAEVSASARQIIESSILEANQSWEQKKQEIENAKNALEAKQEELKESLSTLEAKTKELSDSLSQKEQELSEAGEKIKQYEEAAAAKALEDRFQTRMTEIDEEYDMTDEDREAVLEFVRDYDEEAFASWKNKTFSVLAKGKKKAPKQEVASTENTEGDSTVEDIVASITPKEGEIVNLPTDDLPLREKMKNAFGEDAFEIK